MRRLLVIIMLAGLAAIAHAGVSTAADIVRLTRIDIGFAEPLLKEYLSDACGFPVYVQGDGYLDVTLQYDAEGRLVREAYSTPRSFVTYFAPTTGASYSFPWQPREEFVYPGGAILGGPATYRLTGLIVNHPGVAPEAGLVVVTGTVVDFSPDGVPIVEFTDDEIANAFVRGSLTRASDPTPWICAALGEP
jgi:hypothetical protein